MADVWLTFGISQNSQSIPNNTSNVTVTVYANWRYGYYNRNNKSGTVTINGTPYPFAAPFNTGISSSGSCVICTKTVNVEHNSNGTKTLSVSASYTTGVVGTVSASTIKALTTIPRVSDLSVDVETVLADGTSQVIVTATKKADAFTDVLTVSLGDYSQEVTSGTAFTIPVEWNNAISGTSATATVKVTTKSGSTTIGSATKSLTITVPTTSEFYPTINAVSISEAVASVISAFGNLYVRNLSQLNVLVDASGAYGSTINSYSTSVNGVNYIQQAFTSNVLNSAGDITLTTTVTDSRGRTATATRTINVVDYAMPSITSMTYYPCDDGGNRDSNGTNTKVIISYKVYPVEEQNTKSMKLYYKAMEDEAYTERALTLDDWEGTVETIINNTDPTITYKFLATLTDKITTSDPTTIMTGKIVMSRLAGGKGVRLFGEVYKEGFMVGDVDYTITPEQYNALDDELDCGVDGLHGLFDSTNSKIKDIQSRMTSTVASAKGTINVSLPSGVITKVPLDTWITKTDDTFEFSSDGGIVCPYSGNVLVSGSLYISGDGAGCYLYKNDEELISELQSGSLSCAVGTSAQVIPVNAGDVIYLYGRSHNSTGTAHAGNRGTGLTVMYMSYTTVVGNGTGSGNYVAGSNIDISGNVISVITASDVNQDNTRPITAAAVYTEIGNINALLESI